MRGTLQMVQTDENCKSWTLKENKRQANKHLSNNLFLSYNCKSDDFHLTARGLKMLRGVYWSNHDCPNCKGPKLKNRDLDSRDFN